MLRREDQELCNSILAGGAARSKAIAAIYGLKELKMKVSRYVSQRGGTHNDCLDIFHEGIIALDRNIRAGKFRGETSIEGYLYSICRFTWNNEWRKRSKTASQEIRDHQLEPDVESPEKILFSDEKKRLLSQALELLDSSCLQIMKMWKLSYSMDEIATAQNLSSASMAKKYRYRCMKKLMARLSEHPELLKALENV